MKPSLVGFIQHLKITIEHAEDLKRDHVGSLGEKLFKVYLKWLRWILKDFNTTHLFTDEVRQGIRNEINSDLLAIPSINEKITKLSPEQREVIENVLDQLLAGQAELV